MKIAQGKFTMVADEDHCIATIVFEPPLDDTLVECSGKGVTIYEAYLIYKGSCLATRPYLTSKIDDPTIGVI
ncbi:hypothetical protein LCGC14_0600790 [marine sediment metagenome]|uniref:Uncharacterized protein n=1 Tax=marine sediment metagenome TaxID=412755 RepID=A0A0F9UJ19_9ZZZZ